MKALTSRELQIADLIHQGYVEKEIAGKLFLSPETVHTYKKRLFEKLHARNIADVTRIYLLKLKPFLAPALIVIGLAIYAVASGVDFSTLMDSCMSYLKKMIP